MKKGNDVIREDDEKNEETNWGDDRPFHEGARPRGECAGRLRHPRDCSCGHARALVRRGRRWLRLVACRRCLAQGGSAGTNPLVTEVSRA